MIQTQVLNYLLKTKDTSIITLNSLTDDYFSDYKAEFNFIKNHLMQYGNIPDYSTFMEAFSTFDVVEVNEPVNYLLDELAKDRQKRFIADSFNKVRECMINGDVEKAQSILKESAEFSTQLVSLQSVDLFHDIQQRYDAYVDKVDNPAKYFVTTGFRELDAIIGGWNKEEDVITIVSRNGVGKSWCLLKCAAEAALQGKTVGVFSGEMSEDTVGYRVDSIIGHVSNGALVHGGASVKNEYKAFLEQLQTSNGSLKVLTPKMINGPATVSALRAFIEKENLEVLYVDQHSLLEDERGGKTTPEQAAHISKDIKLLQTIKRIPIVCVSQQNREKTESGVPDSTQIANSDRIGQDSSVIIFLERKDDLLKLHLVKSRNSGCGQTLNYRIDLNRGEFIYVPDENNPIPQSASDDYSADNLTQNYYSADTDVF